jgi:hypothetical protein
MSLYARDPDTSVRVKLFDNKKIFQIGFVVLAVSGLLRVAERMIGYGLHWKELQFTATDWAFVGLSSLVMVAFAIVFLRYFSKGYGQHLLWIPLACTALGWIAFVAWYLFVFVIDAVPSTIILIADWLEIPGYTGSPLACIFGPFMQGRHSYHVYLTYVTNADYVVRLLFLGLCVVKNRQSRQQAAEQVRARIARGLGLSASAR